jgi:hypothetical protein
MYCPRKAGSTRKTGFNKRDPTQWRGERKGGRMKERYHERRSMGVRRNSIN